MVVSIKWFPPSWIQIKADKNIIYIDPAYLRTYYLKHPQKIEFTKWPQPVDGLPQKLKKADLILVTHDHKDHAKDVTMKRLCKMSTRLFGPRRCKKKLKIDMAVIAAGQEIAHENIQVKAVEAYNQIKSSTGKIWHLKGSGVGYLITVEEKRIYHAGDTDFIPEMKQLGHVDLALLPIGGTYTMDLNAAVQAALAIQPQVVIPMHHLKANPQEFKIEIEAKSDIQCAVMQIGEPFFLS